MYLKKVLKLSPMNHITDMLSWRIMVEFEKKNYIFSILTFSEPSEIIANLVPSRDNFSESYSMCLKAGLPYCLCMSPSRI